MGVQGAQNMAGRVCLATGQRAVRAASVVFYNRFDEGGGMLKPGDFDLGKQGFAPGGGRAAWLPSRRKKFFGRRFPRPTAEGLIIEGMHADKAGRGRP